MNTSQGYFRAVAVLLAPLLLGTALLIFLYSSYTRLREAEITQRNYRFLSAVSAQLVSPVEALRIAISTGANADASSLVLLNCKEKIPKESDKQDSAKRSDNSNDRAELVRVGTDLSLQLKLDGNTCTFGLGSILGSAVAKQDFFDFVTLAAANGDVLYNSNPEAPGIANLADLVDAQLRHSQANSGWLDFVPRAVPKVENSNGPASDVRWLGAAQYEHVRYLSDDYLLFSMAVALNVPYRGLTKNNDGPQPQRIGGSSENYDGSKPYILSGLVQAKRFDSETRELPVGWHRMVASALALMLLAWPILSFSFMSARERLRAFDLWSLTFCILVISMIFTVLVLGMPLLTLV